MKNGYENDRIVPIANGLRSSWPRIAQPLAYPLYRMGILELQKQAHEAVAIQKQKDNQQFLDEVLDTLDFLK